MGKSRILDILTFWVDQELLRYDSSTVEADSTLNCHILMQILCPFEILSWQKAAFLLSLWGRLESYLPGSIQNNSSFCRLLNYNTSVYVEICRHVTCLYTLYSVYCLFYTVCILYNCYGQFLFGCLGLLRWWRRSSYRIWSSAPFQRMRCDTVMGKSRSKRCLKVFKFTQHQIDNFVVSLQRV